VRTVFGVSKRKATWLIRWTTAHSLSPGGVAAARPGAREPHRGLVREGSVEALLVGMVIQGADRPSAAAGHAHRGGPADESAGEPHCREERRTRKKERIDDLCDA